MDKSLSKHELEYSRTTLISMSLTENSVSTQTKIFSREQIHTYEGYMDTSCFYGLEPNPPKSCVLEEDRRLHFRLHSRTTQKVVLFLIFVRSFCIDTFQVADSPTASSEPFGASHSSGQ